MSDELGTALTALDSAKDEVSSGERELERLLSEIAIAPRAEKTSVSKTIEQALQRLRAGRAKMEEALRTLARLKGNS